MENRGENRVAPDRLRTAARQNVHKGIAIRHTFPSRKMNRDTTPMTIYATLIS